MPVRNGATYIGAAIESILVQTHVALELVVGDNASEDETEQIVRSYAAEDPRIRYIRHQKNLGAAPNYNFVFSQSRGAFFKWAAHDDLVRPTFIERCLEVLRQNPSAVVAFPDATFIDERGSSIRHHAHTAPWRGESASTRLSSLLLHPDSYLLNCFPVMGLVRSEALRRTKLIGGYQSADKVLVVQLALLGDLMLLPERLFLRRDHVAASRRANTTPIEIARWFDSGYSRRVPKPRSTLLHQYTGSVLRADLREREKVRCALVLAGWLRRNRTWRVILGEHRLAAREAFGGLRSHSDAHGPGV